MLATPQGLFQSLALLVVASLVLGLVFDGVRSAPHRKLLVGLVCGLFASIAMLFTQVEPSGFMVDGRSVFMLVAGLFAGPWGALAAVPLPILLRLDAGGPAVPVGIAAILLAVAIGYAIRFAHHRLKRPLQRSSVVALALASPLVLVTLLIPTGIAPEAQIALLSSLAIWLPLGSLVLGLLVLNELTRSEATHRERAKKRFLSATQCISLDAFQQQVEHKYRLFARYGSMYGYLLISIDDAPSLHGQLGEERWDELRSRVANVIGDQVRECDLIAALDFDRFAVLLPFVSLNTALPIAERIQKGIAEVFAKDEALTVSIGLADATNTSSPEDTQVKAEGALFLANLKEPKGAIGPKPDAEGQLPTITRSFPGAASAGLPPLNAAEEQTLADVIELRLPDATPVDGISSGANVRLVDPDEARRASTGS